LEGPEGWRILGASAGGSEGVERVLEGSLSKVRIPKEIWSSWLSLSVLLVVVVVGSFLSCVVDPGASGPTRKEEEMVVTLGFVLCVFFLSFFIYKRQRGGEKRLQRAEETGQTST
jgi:hypothetical protein